MSIFIVRSGRDSLDLYTNIHVIHIVNIYTCYLILQKRAGSRVLWYCLNGDSMAFRYNFAILCSHIKCRLPLCILEWSEFVCI